MNDQVNPEVMQFKDEVNRQMEEVVALVHKAKSELADNLWKLTDTVTGKRYEIRVENGHWNIYQADSDTNNPSNKP